MHELVNLIGGHTGFDQRPSKVQHLRGQPACTTHRIDTLAVVQLQGWHVVWRASTHVRWPRNVFGHHTHGGKRAELDRWAPWLRRQAPPTLHLTTNTLHKTRHGDSSVHVSRL